MTAKILFAIIVFCAFTTIYCQRSPYAGSRPNGYKDKFADNTQNPVTEAIVNRFDSDPNYVQRPPVNLNNVVVAEPNFAVIARPQNNNNNNNVLDNRFGENNPNGNLPHEAYGDKDLVDRYNREPVNHRPFWLVNQAAIEAQKGGSGLPNQQNNQQNLVVAGANNDVPLRRTVEAIRRQGGTSNQGVSNNQNIPNNQQIIANNQGIPTNQNTQNNQRIIQNNQGIPTNQRISNNQGAPNGNVGQINQRFDRDSDSNYNQLRQNQQINQNAFPNGGLTYPDRIQQFVNGPNGPYGSFNGFGGYRRPNSLWFDYLK